MGSRREIERSRNMLTSKLPRKVTWVQCYRRTSGEGKGMSHLRVVPIRARELGYTRPELTGIWLNVGLKQIPGHFELFLRSGSVLWHVKAMLPGGMQSAIGRESTLGV